MDDSLLLVLFVVAGIGGVGLWRWLSGVQARARERLGRAFANLESAIRADERRRAEMRLAELLLDAVPPAAPPPKPDLLEEPPARPRLDDRVAWEK